MFGRRVLFLTIIYFYLALAVPNPANGVIPRDPAAIGDLSSTSNHAIATRQGGGKCTKPPQAAEDAAKEIADDHVYTLSVGCNHLDPRAGKMESCVDEGKGIITVKGSVIKAALYSCEGPNPADGSYKLTEGVALKLNSP